ncbi:MAG TPA: tetratricopeptide repeat protein [Acidimicrobiales bacterium]
MSDTSDDLGIDPFDGPSQANAAMLDGLNALLTGDRVTGGTLLRRVVSSVHTSADNRDAALLALASDAERAGEFDEAVKWYDRAAREGSGDTTATATEALFVLQQRDAALAMGAADTPQEAAAMLEAAREALLRDDEREAERFARGLLEGPASGESIFGAWLVLGEVAFKRSMFDEAKEWFDAVAAAGDQQERQHAERWLRYLGEITTGERAAADGVQAHENDEVLQAVWRAMDMEDYATAERLLLAVMGGDTPLDDRFDGILLDLGKATERQGRVDEAIYWYDQVGGSDQSQAQERIQALRSLQSRTSVDPQ